MQNMESASQTSSSLPNFSSAPSDEYSNHPDIFLQHFVPKKITLDFFLIGESLRKKQDQ